MDKKLENNILSSQQNNHIMEFIFSSLTEVTRDLGLPDKSWALGGSVAIELYGGTLCRKITDIDVIVPVGYIEVVKKMMKNSYKYKNYLNLDSNYGNHFIIITANNIEIDFIEMDEDEFRNAVEDTYKLLGFNLMKIEHLLKIKLQYGRPKDFEDLKNILKIFNPLKNNDFLNEIQKEIDKKVNMIIDDDDKTFNMFDLVKSEI